MPLSHLSPLPEVSLLADRNKNAPILLHEQNGEDQMLHEHKAVHQKGSPRLDQGVLLNAHIVLSSPGELADKFFGLALLLPLPSGDLSLQLWLGCEVIGGCSLLSWRWGKQESTRRVGSGSLSQFSKFLLISRWDYDNSCGVWHTMRPQRMLVATVNVYTS